MENTTTGEEKTRKIVHDIRSRLSVISAAGELLLLDEKTIPREDAIAVVKQTLAEVDEIVKLLSEI
jgi:signal transduction histidine kinase